MGDFPRRLASLNIACVSYGPDPKTLLHQRGSWGIRSWGRELPVDCNAIVPGRGIQAPAWTGLANA